MIGLPGRVRGRQVDPGWLPPGRRLPGPGADRRGAGRRPVLAVHRRGPARRLGADARHALDEGVYIRSMATRGHLGGLAQATPQAVRVLDAAGCDVVLVETVGVGQAEVEVAGLADATLVALALGFGDAVQVAKAGILEVADVFVVNKADRDGCRGGRPRPAPDAPPGRGQALAGPGGPDRGRARRRGREAGRGRRRPPRPPGVLRRADRRRRRAARARSRRSPWPTSAPSSGELGRGEALDTLAEQVAGGARPLQRRRPAPGRGQGRRG